MHDLIKVKKQFIGKNEVDTVEGRELHMFLGNKQRFCTWIASRISKHKFIDGIDFIKFNGFLKSPTKLCKEYTLSIDMAKALSLLENSDVGRNIRAYFIEYEKNLPLEIIEPKKVEMKSLVKTEERTMSSTQLAELLNYESKSSINKAIKKMFQAKIDDSIIAPSLDSRGYVIEYYLPELESKMFVAKKDINYLEKITRFWIDQNKNPFQDLIPKNFPDALQLAHKQACQIVELQTQAEESRPKLELANKIEASVNSLLIGDYAKVISKNNGFIIGGKNFYKWLRHERIVNKKNRPYQRYLDNGWLEVTGRTYENENTDGPIVCSTTFITGKGQIAILKKFQESEYSQGYLNKNAKSNKRAMEIV